MADTEKTLKTRILLSYDLAENWESIPEFTPERGEVIVVADSGTNTPEYFVVGDGQTQLIPGEDKPTLPKFYPFNPADVNLDNYYTMAQTNAAITTAINKAIGIALNETTYPTSNS